MGQQIGTTGNFIHLIEADKRLPSKPLALKIAQVLELNPNQLFDCIVKRKAFLIEQRFFAGTGLEIEKPEPKPEPIKVDNWGKDRYKLPEWKSPENKEQVIEQMKNAGNNLYACGYIAGKDLIWVKAKLKKERIGHYHQFQRWIKQNLWFSKIIAYQFINYAKQCDQVGKLMASNEIGRNIFWKLKLSKSASLTTPNIKLTGQIAEIKPIKKLPDSVDFDKFKESSHYQQLMKTLNK